MYTWFCDARIHVLILFIYIFMWTAVCDACKILYYSCFWKLHWDACDVLILPIGVEIGIWQLGWPAGLSPGDVTNPSIPVILWLAVRVAHGGWAPRTLWTPPIEDDIEIVMTWWYFAMLELCIHVPYLTWLCRLYILLVIALESWLTCWAL